MASCRASMATTSSDHDVLITAGRRMVEGRPCAEGGSRDPVVRARHPCPPMPEPMPSASELPHHSMMRMILQDQPSTAWDSPAARACATAESCHLQQKRYLPQRALCPVPSGRTPARLQKARYLGSTQRAQRAQRRKRLRWEDQEGDQEGRQERKELSWAGVTMASLADAGCLAAGAGTGTGAGTRC
ncbi:uncharacterized protein K441DRAFT_734398 [Cenococcum geophilum 1.58]|uniref:uncharacterized protein n=1 Tax=Cenococcum geophilum 1.58 TaxID=794803 RepID=UPI00358FE54A|nr:hypothetical protein K441DRAFT_734398 [Cenococcum geophilum 1.58]